MSNVIRLVPQAGEMRESVVQSLRDVADRVEAGEDGPIAMLCIVVDEEGNFRSTHMGADLTVIGMAQFFATMQAFDHE